jgi:hypothetical protein
MDLDAIVRSLDAAIRGLEKIRAQLTGHTAPLKRGTLSSVVQKPQRDYSRANQNWSTLSPMKAGFMTENKFLIRFKPSGPSSHLVVVATAAIHGDHLVFLRSDGSLAALFVLEVVESWSEVDPSGL